MYFAAVVVMSTLERVRMEFNCYDVLEVHGSRYVITEKIKYIEIIPKADKEQSYRGQPSMTKSPGDYWHEYGLEAVEGIDKIWLTIEYNDNEWCTVSRTSFHTRPGKDFTLHQIGLEKVVDVDGESGASVGDRAGYREYQLPCEGGASVFFEEEWLKVKKCLPKDHECPWRTFVFVMMQPLKLLSKRCVTNQ